MKIKTAEATKLQLDWGVAEVMRLEPELAHHECYRYGVVVLARPSLKSVKGLKEGFSHTDPAVWGDLIERRNLDVNHRDPLRIDDSVLVSWGDPNDFAYGYWFARGKTLPEAVARCVIGMKLGDEFEVPDELGVQS